MLTRTKILTLLDEAWTAARRIALLSNQIADQKLHPTVSEDDRRLIDRLDAAYEAVREEIISENKAIRTASSGEPRTHYLKSWPEFFQDMANGRKSFDVRYNDRDYRVGDAIVISEWDAHLSTPLNLRDRHTGRKLVGMITCVTGCPSGDEGSFQTIPPAPNALVILGIRWT